jgi:hypothetical protein
MAPLWTALRDLQQVGKVRDISLSNMDIDQIEDALMPLVGATRRATILILPAAASLTLSEADVVRPGGATQWTAATR